LEDWIIATLSLGGIAGGFILYLLKKRDDRKSRIQKLKDDVAIENAKRDREAADRAGIKGRLAVRENGEVGNDHVHQPISEKVSVGENVVAIVNRNTKPFTANGIVVSPPVVEVVNTHPEPSGQNPIASYFPNFRNDGQTTIGNISIGYRVLDEVLELPDIMKLEQEIKSTYIKVPGSIAPTRSINLNDGRKGIEWQKGDKPVNVVLWFAYEYDIGSGNGYDETIFNIRYDLQLRPVGAVIRYTSSDIGKVRQTQK
jgi:hypothetical protein